MQQGDNRTFYAADEWAFPVSDFGAGVGWSGFLRECFAFRHTQGIIQSGAGVKNEQSSHTQKHCKAQHMTLTIS